METSTSSSRRTGMLIGLSLYVFSPYCCSLFSDHFTPTAPRCRSRVDISARRGDDTREPEGGRSSNIRLALLSLTCFLKANILIDQRGHPRLTDFGLITIISDPTYPTTPTASANAGTARWTSPELLDPGLFGFKNSRPTKESDCYALGMVIYEVLSGKSPLRLCEDHVVSQKIIDGMRPGRPGGLKRAWFTDDLWEMLELCWSSQPKSRPTTEAVLECLERVSPAWQPLPPSADGDAETDVDDDSYLVLDNPGMFPHPAGNLGLTFEGDFQSLGCHLLSCWRSHRHLVRLWRNLPTF